MGSCLGEVVHTDAALIELAAGELEPAGAWTMKADELRFFCDAKRVQPFRDTLAFSSTASLSASFRLDLSTPRTSRFKGIRILYRPVLPAGKATNECRLSARLLFAEAQPQVDNLPTSFKEAATSTDDNLASVGNSNFCSASVVVVGTGWMCEVELVISSASCAYSNPSPFSLAVGINKLSLLEMDCTFESLEGLTLERSESLLAFELLAFGGSSTAALDRCGFEIYNVTLEEPPAVRDIVVSISDSSDYLR